VTAAVAFAGSGVATKSESRRISRKLTQPACSESLRLYPLPSACNLLPASDDELLVFGNDDAALKRLFAVTVCDGYAGWTDSALVASRRGIKSVARRRIHMAYNAVELLYRGGHGA